MYLDARQSMFLFQADLAADCYFLEMKQGICALVSDEGGEPLFNAEYIFLQDLVRQILHVNPRHRITASQVTIPYFLDNIHLFLKYVKKLQLLHVLSNLGFDYLYLFVRFCNIHGLLAGTIFHKPDSIKLAASPE